MAGGELQAALEATPGGGAMTLVVEHRPQIAMRIREGGLDSQGPAIGLRSLVVGLRIRVDTDSRRNTPLHTAVRTARIAKVTVLLDSGANPNASNDLGQTPLHLAEPSNRALVTLLLVHGADPNIKNIKDESPLDLWPELAEIVKELEAEKAGKQQPAQPKVPTP